MLDRLIDYLGAALPRVRQADTTLGQELELAHAYLDLHQIRIGGRLGFSIEVPGEMASVRFPPLMLLTLENGLYFQRRTVTGATSRATQAVGGKTSRWLKLQRTGQVITASRSEDGRTWTVVGRDSLSIVGAAYIGLAVSNHGDPALSTAAFDSVIVR